MRVIASHSREDPPVAGVSQQLTKPDRNRSRWETWENNEQEPRRAGSSFAIGGNRLWAKLQKRGRPN
jgi:hypothetical protein